MTDIRRQTTEHLLAGLEEQAPTFERRKEASVSASKKHPDPDVRTLTWGRLVLHRPEYPLEAFGEPEPDVCEPERESPPPGRPRPPASPLILGTYTLGLQHARPGLVTLYADNLKRYFHSLLWQLGEDFPHYPADRGIAEAIAEWTVEKTYWHERFHHAMDVLRTLFGARNRPDPTEEALAVAFSRRWLSERYRSASQRPLPQSLWLRLMELGFQYQSPGYRDWGRHVDEAGFAQGIIRYLALDEETTWGRLDLNAAERLEKLGVQLTHWQLGNQTHRHQTYTLWMLYGQVVPVEWFIPWNPFRLTLMQGIPVDGGFGEAVVY